MVRTSPAFICFKIIFIALLLIGITAFLNADTNKTTLSPRPLITYTPLLQSLWKHQTDAVQFCTPKEQWTGALQVFFLLQESENKTAIGSYFGINNRNTITIAPHQTPRIPANLYSQTLIHNHEHATSKPSTLQGTLSLRPQQTRYSSVFTFHKRLGKRLYATLTLPCSYLKHELNATVHNETTEHTHRSNYGVLDYFAGAVEQIHPSDKQEKLRCAKIKNLHTRTGIENVQASLGLSLLDTEHDTATCAATVTFPSGTQPTGEYLFEPSLGNNKHWGIGAQITTKHAIMHTPDTLVIINNTMELSYVFKNTQKRTLSILDPEGAEHQWGQYVLGGKNGEYGTFPLANVLTRTVSVAPRLQGTGTVTFSVVKKKHAFDLGYSLHARSAEKISDVCWPNNTYAIAKTTYDTQLPFDHSQALEDFISSDTLNHRTAESSVAISHIVFASIGASITRGCHPLTVAGGFAKEFSCQNTALAPYLFWFKTGLSF